MKTAEGNSFGGSDDHWIVNCPYCDYQIEYTGWFDPDDDCECPKCREHFKTIKVWIDEKHYIK